MIPKSLGTCPAEYTCIPCSRSLPKFGRKVPNTSCMARWLICLKAQGLVWSLSSPFQPFCPWFQTVMQRFPTELPSWWCPLPGGRQPHGVAFAETPSHTRISCRCPWEYCWGKTNPQPSQASPLAKSPILEQSMEPAPLAGLQPTSFTTKLFFFLFFFFWLFLITDRPD